MERLRELRAERIKKELENTSRKFAFYVYTVRVLAFVGLAAKVFLFGKLLFMVSQTEPLQHLSKVLMVGIVTVLLLFLKKLFADLAEAARKRLEFIVLSLKAMTDGR